jgi:hypothetical protein
MKAFSSTTLIFLAGALAGAFPALSAQAARVSGPWVELRQAPVFDAPTQALAKNWGPALPAGTEFKVEKVYGRWLYGTPEPPAKMPKKEYAKPGWVFSRMLLIPGDEDTLPAKLVKQAEAMIYHGRAAWKKLGIGKEPLVSPLDFYEGLTLSQGTLKAFQAQDEAPMAWRLPAFISTALAEEPKEPPPLGLTGSSLSFLDQEFKVLQDGKKAAAAKREALKLKPPSILPLDQGLRSALLGRFMLQKYFELPPLTHEEVDGFIYMRATAMRSLAGCPKHIRDYWKNRRWNFFRAYRLKSRPEIPHPWLETSLPGGYFAVSGRAIGLAGNEAELAFLLVRPLVREMRIQHAKLKFDPKAWPAELESISEEQWSQVLKAQSTKDSVNLDVADEIAVDIAATECISRAGYRPMAGLSYLRNLSMKKEESWAKWFFDHSIGLEYRLERLGALTEEALAKEKFPAGKSTNPKRFATASRYWNLLP